MIWFWYSIGGFFLTLLVVYVLVRVGSIAHYRTREEYDRTIRRLFNGDEKDGL